MTLNSKLMVAIAAAVRSNELGTASPYRLSYAGIAQSGASFGACQGDTSANHDALATLSAILADVPPVRRAGWLAVLALPCPRSPLNIADAAEIDAAIASPPGQALTDAMDARLLRAVFLGVEQCRAAAHQGLADDGAIGCALWINQSGPPTALLRYLAARDRAVGQADVAAYVKATAYFQAHRANYEHFQAAWRVGMEALTGAA